MRSLLDTYRAPFVGGMTLLLLVLPMMRVGRYNAPMFWDDISIVFVYALNLLEHGAIFYNTPADRLDGFTSMLDVLFVMPLALLSPENLFTLNYYAKALLTSLLPVAIFAALLKQQLHPAVAATVALAVAMAETPAHGFGMQLEAPYYGLLIVGFLTSLISRHAQRTAFVAVSGILLCLARPESLALTSVALACFLLLFRRDERFRGTAVAAVIIAAVMLAWIGWRISYFGYWAPNTYYAKMSGTRGQEIIEGLQFVGRHLLRAPESLLYAALAMLSLTLLPAALRKHADIRARYFLVCAATAWCMLAVRIATGGDSYWMSSRLMMDFLVTAALATGIGLAASRYDIPTRLAVILVVLSVASGGFFIVRHLPANLTGFVAVERHANRTLACERSAVLELQRQYPGATLAHTDFQRAKYFAPDMEVIDLSGLNNRDIAHGRAGSVNVFGKHDLQYGLDQQADVFKLGTGVRETAVLTESDWLQTLSGNGTANRQLKGVAPFLQANQDIFSRDYTPLAIPTGCDDYINLIVRQDMRAAAVDTD